MSVINQRNNALSVLDSNLGQISKLYKECFLAMGRGALLVYAIDVIEGNLPNRNDYRKKEEILDVFDAPDSHDQLEVMIDKYDHKNEGIMTLITSYSNATYFVTVNLRLGSDQADRYEFNRLTHKTGCFQPLKASF